MMRVLRVFPQRTSYTPTDNLAFIGPPPLERPEADKVMVSCCFTWDRKESEYLAEAWSQYYSDVELGGPAYGSPCNTFTPGMFVRQGITFTSRGCENHCPECFVPEREGTLRELPICAGHIIQDNNLLQCSWQHQQAVFSMLNKQSRAADFRGGFQADLVTEQLSEALRRIRVASAWLACDRESSIDPLREAARILSWLGRNKLYCYVLAKPHEEPLERIEARIRAVWNAGCIPFVQLYRDPDDKIAYPREVQQWARLWCRPAVIKAILGGHDARPPTALADPAYPLAAPGCR